MRKDLDRFIKRFRLICENVIDPALIDAIAFAILVAIFTAVALFIRLIPEIGSIITEMSIWISSCLLLLAFFVAICFTTILRYRIWAKQGFIAFNPVQHQESFE